jgi:hypothetical protein
LFIRLPEGFAATAESRLALFSGDVQHELPGGFIESNLFAVKNAGCFVENIALQAAFADIFVHHRSLNEHAFEAIEKLEFHQSFFAGLFDLSKSTDIYLLPGHFAKPASLAIAAVYTGDRTLLKFWATYYSRLISPSQLYVLDGSGATDTKTVLPSDINIVRLEPAELDPHGFREAANYFQRFLLSNYQWVVQTSSSEILLHRQGISKFFNGLTERTAPVILRPDRYFSLTSEAFGASGEKPVGTLPHMVSVPSTAKPALASMPMSWANDFETVLEQYAVKAEPGLWLIGIVNNKASAATGVSTEIASMTAEAPALEVREA